jgi:hypothetical protein
VSLLSDWHWRIWRLLHPHGSLRRVCVHDGIVGVSISEQRSYGGSIEWDGAMAILDYDRAGRLCAIELIGIPERIEDALASDGRRRAA